MRSEQDLDDYFSSLLDIKSPVHKQFLLDLKKRHRLCKFIQLCIFINVLNLTYLIKLTKNQQLVFRIHILPNRLQKARKKKRIQQALIKNKK